MAIESIMFFALGFLAAAFFALMVLPAIWRRAVRLTKRRIEAATPMTMAEFRADKDQLRAEFALTTRSMEKKVERLRTKLAEQLGEANRSKTERAVAILEARKQSSIAEELAVRVRAAQERVHALEKEFADVAQKLRMREMSYNDRLQEIAALRQELADRMPYRGNTNGDELTGEYDRDVGGLLQALAAEQDQRRRLEERARALLIEMESAERQSSDARSAIEELRDELARKDNERRRASPELRDAENRFANAESHLKLLLAEVEGSNGAGSSAQNGSTSLAAQLSLDDKLGGLYDKITSIERDIVVDWDGSDEEADRLRDRLIDIASEVSIIVYASEDDEKARTAEESLFDRVQKFASDSLDVEDIPVGAAANSDGEGARTASSLGGRMAAVRNIQIR